MLDPASSEADNWLEEKGVRLARFALFMEDQYGPMFRQHQEDLSEARRKAQELADREGVPVFIFSFQDARRLDTFEPRPESNSECSRPASV